MTLWSLGDNKRRWHGTLAITWQCLEATSRAQKLYVSTKLVKTTGWHNARPPSTRNWVLKTKVNNQYACKGGGWSLRRRTWPPLYLKLTFIWAWKNLISLNILMMQTHELSHFRLIFVSCWPILIIKKSHYLFILEFLVSRKILHQSIQSCNIQNG